ncbi:MAG: T9SS type A sorting domain-containing protein [Candidatus Cloacimonetes bacterium]|nr:T9SS type A sorting domain-containing protein [Candidatus Cloacimonadota bacterium]
MKWILALFFLIFVWSSIWAGFELENFNDASVWEGYEPIGYPSYAPMTFNGNQWSFTDVVQYTSGSDYELEIRHAGPGPGKISSHQFTNGAGTLTFNAYYVDNPGKVHILYSPNNSNWYYAEYDKSINTASSSSYSVAINNSQAKYIRIQSSTSLINKVRIDDIALSDELAPELPVVAVAGISNITKFTAQGGGNVTSDGGAIVTARGICWSTSQGPNLSNCGDNFTVDGSGTGSYISQLTGLSANTFYYVRAYATNSVGTAYSEYNFPATFTTQNYVAPTAVTDNASSVNHVFARLNGTVNGDEAETTVVFEYGLTEDYGSEITADQSPLTGAGDQAAQASLSELDEYTTYHYRVKATNVIGTTYGSDKTFTTANNPNQTSTQSIPAEEPDPDPIDFTGTGVTVDFSGVSGATGTDDITVSKYNEQPTDLSGLIGSELNIAGTSYLFTNHTGFTFSSEIRFLISDIPGVNPSLFSNFENGDPTDISLWKRPEYGTGEFVNQGYLLYNKGADNTNVTADDYLYMDGISDFSEITFTSSGDHYLPVTLSSFTSLFADNAVLLNWTTQSETGNLGWFVYRNIIEELNESMQLNTDIIPGAGTTSEPTDYSYLDELPAASGTTYYYWLESIDISGFSQTFGPLTAVIPPDNQDPDLPEIPQWIGARNYPNPFNPNTVIEYSLPETCSGEIIISVYNIHGQTVTEFRIINDESLTGSVIWNGRDESGKAVASGVYFCRVQAGKTSYSHKMVMMK